MAPFVIAQTSISSSLGIWAYSCWCYPHSVNVTLNMFHIHLVNVSHQWLQLQLIHHHLNNKEMVWVNFNLCTWKWLCKILVWIVRHLVSWFLRNWFWIVIILMSSTFLSPRSSDQNWSELIRTAQNCSELIRTDQNNSYFKNLYY